ncbi:hypothetical protein [Nannocystis exedens]|uniref:hypothetical protein n=1 Tax=Nannocystis exedens TaxID=54 RepID=UPI000BBA09D5|nr:hypothetical protein [Nannocystis exedens]PCC72381.1 hypothetical protein NAEX_05461 [Nannocystis exedens]
MMIFNVLFSAWAALAAPERPVEEIADEAATQAGDVSTDEFDLTDEVDPSESERWECYDDDHHRRGYCLARCERGRRYRAVTDRIKIRGNRDYCERRAYKHCRGRGGLDDWCFGERD